MLSKTCDDHVKPIIQSTKLQIVFCQSFCVSATGVRGGGRFKNFQEKLPDIVKLPDIFGHWASCLSRTIVLQNFPIRFPHSGAKTGRIEKFSPKVKGSRMPLVVLLELSSLPWFVEACRCAQ